jgi:hypothetical protein
MHPMTYSEWNQTYRIIYIDKIKLRNKLYLKQKININLNVNFRIYFLKYIPMKMSHRRVGQPWRVGAGQLSSAPLLTQPRRRRSRANDSV